VAADLHLMVETPEIRNGPVGQPLAEIAGPVEARSCTAKRIGNKALLGQLGAFQVASRHAGSANQDFTGYADRQRPQRSVDDIDRGVRNRLSDRDRIIGAAHRTGGRPDARFCRAIHVVDVATVTCPQSLEQRARQRLTAQQQLA
jgi:hypothetical protein